MAGRRLLSRLVLFKQTTPLSSPRILCPGNTLGKSRSTGTFTTASRRFFSARPILVGVGGTFLGVYIVHSYTQSPATVNAKEVNEKVLSRREQRFHDFASCEISGQVVMTPYDFIESLIENEPKLPRTGKFRVKEKELRRIIRRTPSVEKGSTTFFRDMHQDGIITYSEYLFLVTILTKSNAGLKIALKMMDMNGDKKINYEEFKLIERMINESASAKTGGDGEKKEDLKVTTLLLHLFGVDGMREVLFEDFFRFMDHLQTEVLELEFHEYSKSLNFISELDFAKILLRNTTLTELEYECYLDRLKSRVVTPRGVSLEDFKAFNVFLSNIDDFIIAVNMTNVSGQELDKEFFRRAVHVVTGLDIDTHIIDVVFSLFDNDGDGKLSQNEFIGIIKDRLKRGFGKFPNLSGFRGFKHCLKKEMIKSNE